MLELKTDWGRCEITLNEYLARHKISKSRLSRTAEIQYSQLQAYCKMKFSGLISASLPEFAAHWSVTFPI